MQSGPSPPLLGAEGWSGEPGGPFPRESSCDAAASKRVYLTLCFFLLGQQKLPYKTIQAATCREVPNGEEIEKPSQLLPHSEFQSVTQSC